MDQRSGVGWFSGRIEIFVIYSWYCNAEFWSTWCEDCFSLNKIIHHSHFKRRISLEEQEAQKQDRFLRGRQIAYLIYDQFRVTGSHDSVENYTDLFTIVLRNDNVQEFDSKWGGNLLSMTKIPSDDILEGLCKLRIRESEKLKTVLEMYDLEIHQKKAGPDYHRWKTMVKEVSSRIYEWRILAPETEIMREMPWSRIKGQNSVDKVFLEIVGNGKLTGSVLKETIAVSVRILISVQKRRSRILLRALLRGRMREMHREPGVPEARVSVEGCFDFPARITSNELAPIHSVKNGILQNACSTCPRMDADLVKSALMRIDRLKNSQAKGLKRMVIKVQWPCWKVHDNWAAYFRMWSRRSLHRFCGRRQTYGKQSDVFNSLKPSYVMLTCETKIHRLEWFAQVILISVTTMLQNLRIGLRKRQEGESACAAAWRLVKSVLRLKEKNKASFFSPSENWCLPCTSHN